MESVLCEDGGLRLPECILKDEIRRIRSLGSVKDIYILLKDTQFGSWDEASQKMIRRDHRGILMDIAQNIHSHIFQSNTQNIKE